MTEQQSSGKANKAGALLSALFLGACAVNLVTPYDEVIDNGLMSFNQSFLQFMARIKQDVPSEDGSYASNTSFYDTQEAAIATLIQRAEASDPDGSCPGTELTAEAAQRVDAIVLPKDATASSTEPPKTGSCITILLDNIQEQLLDTACFHRAIYGATASACETRGFTASVAQSLENAPRSTKQTLLEQVQSAVTTSVTAALTLELAKKQGTN